MDNVILRAKTGDEQAIEQIVSQYKGLIRAYANKFFLVGGDKDDLLQEGMLGLFCAITNYDETKGTFPSFVKLCVLRQLLNAVRSDCGVKNQPLTNCIDIDDVKDYEDVGATPLETLIDKEYFARITQLINVLLTPTERAVLTLFSEGYRYDEITRQTGKSYKAIDGALQRARKKLINYLNSEQD